MSARTVTSFVVLIFASLTSVARGELITYTFSGSITQLSGAGFLGGSIPTGSSFSGTCTFDSAVADALDEDPSTGSYLNALAEFSLQLSSHTLVGTSTTDIIRVENNVILGEAYPSNRAGDAYTVEESTTSLAGRPVQVRLRFSKQCGDVFTSDALPLAPPDPLQFDWRELRIINTDSLLPFTIGGSVTSIAWQACISGQGSNDCDQDGTSDACEFSNRSASDCNENRVPDHCETGPAADCNGNSVPDDCETQADCNSNGIQDLCDIAGGTSDDSDANGIPDECYLLRMELDQLIGYYGGHAYPPFREVTLDLGYYGFSELWLNVRGILYASTSLLEGSINGLPGRRFELIEENYCFDVTLPVATLFPMYGTGETIRLTSYRPCCDQQILVTEVVAWFSIPSSWLTCDILPDPEDDCDGNEVHDVCDIEACGCADCNLNGFHDSCPAEPGTDCNGNDVPDACEVSDFGLAMQLDGVDDILTGA